MQTHEPDLSRDAEVVSVAAYVPEINAVSVLPIKTPAQFTDAGNWLKTIKGLLGKIETARTRITQPMNQALRAVNEQAREQSAPLLDAETKLKRSIGAYTAEQERIRREEQRKADEVARKERERLAAEARAAEAAARAKAEEQRKASEAAAAAGRKAEAAKLAAKAAETQARAESKVTALEVQAAAVVAPVIQRAPPKVAGIVTKDVWKFEVTDHSLVPREYMSVDETKIRKVVGALKGDTSIAGVRVYAEKQIASGVA